MEMADDVSLETMRFEDLGNGRTRLHSQALVDSFEGRDAWLASGMETGVNDGYRKLDALIALARLQTDQICPLALSPRIPRQSGRRKS